MISYWFNRQELLEKAKGRYRNCGGKREAAEYYIADKDVLKGKAKNRYKDLSEEKKKQRENIHKAGANTWKKIQANRVLKK